MNNKNSYDKRRSNIPNGGRNSKNQNKVNNGVFVYNRAMSVSELAKQLNITPSDIIKFLFDMHQWLVKYHQLQRQLNEMI